MNFRATHFLILFLWLFVSCSTKSTLDPPKPAVVSIKAIKLEPISDLFTYPARVRAKVNAAILSESDGIVTQLVATLGGKVRSRQTLMILRHTDPVYQYAPVQILAPIHGIVSSIDVTQGSHVVQGQKLAAVIDPSKLEIQVEIPAQDLSLIKKKAQGIFRISDQESLTVQVTGVSPFVDPGTGTALAQLDIVPKSDHVLSPGMQGQVTFKGNLHDGILIPDSSIVYKGKDTFAKLVENKKVKQVPIVLGKKQRGLVEILKGLSPNDQLIERSSRYAAEGEEVVVESTSTP